MSVGQWEQGAPAQARPPSTAGGGAPASGTDGSGDAAWSRPRGLAQARGRSVEEERANCSLRNWAERDWEGAASPMSVS